MAVVTAQFNKPITLNTKGASELLGVPSRTLVHWRESGCGPKYFHASDSPQSTVLYRYEDLIKWADKRAAIEG